MANNSTITGAICRNISTFVADNGQVIEYDCGNDTEICSSWILLPAENLWNGGLRGFLYVVGMFYTFIGIAIASDIFMGSIEVITAKKRTIVLWDEERQERVERKVLVWNETVANLTLMALGSSAPEILLALVETCQQLPMTIAKAKEYETQDGLGTFTIMGSAAYNLLMISAICIIAVKLPSSKKVSQFSVFLLTSVWSIWAYVWMLLVVSFITPGVVDIWEAWITLLFLPIMALTAYGQDNSWWIWKCKKRAQVVGVNEEDQQTQNYSQPNIRVLTNDHHGLMHGPSRELKLMEHQHHQKELRKSHCNLHDIEEGQDGEANGFETPSKVNNHRTSLSLAEGSRIRPSSTSSAHHNVRGLDYSFDHKVRRQSYMSLNIQDVNNNELENYHHDSQVSLTKTSQQPNVTANAAVARARFRHAAVRQMMGAKQTRPKTPGSHHAQHHESRLLSLVDNVRLQSQVNPLNEEELCGKFTFAAPSYSVLESAGVLEVDVLFHRKKPSQSKKIVQNGNTTSANSVVSNGTAETTLGDDDKITGVVAVCWETREGSAKSGRDFRFSSGKLVFQADDFKKTVTIPIVNDNDFEPDTDFYLILKNPEGDAGLGDPSIARVTIIDDDEPGEFLFEKQHYYADKGACTVTVIRRSGCDGEVKIEYGTIDGTAKGGENVDSADYLASSGTLVFKHGEASKNLTLTCTPESKGAKNFIVTLRNPSLGARIGQHSAAVVNLSSDDIGDRLAEVLAEEEEELTFCGQFRAALTLSPDDDDDDGDDDEGDESGSTSSSKSKAPTLKWHDYVMHFLSLPWKLICAFIPPKNFAGAWPTFVLSLLWIGGMTAIVEQLAKLLGCVIGLKTAVTGITLVALGTSVPDTFASRTAAIQDEYADAAIGNITGSNSVNVFLGLGLPWVLLSMWYNYLLGIPYTVSSGNLVQAVVLFGIFGIICLIVLFLRRVFAGGELGGNKMIAYGSAIFLTFMWVLFLVIVSLIAYGIITWSALDPQNLQS